MREKRAPFLLNFNSQWNVFIVLERERTRNLGGSSRRIKVSSLVSPSLFCVFCFVFFCFSVVICLVSVCLFFLFSSLVLFCVFVLFLQWFFNV